MALPRWLTGTAANVISAANTVSNALPGKNTSTGYNLADAIRDPNQVYTGGLTGLVDSKNNFQTVSRPSGVLKNEGSQSPYTGNESAVSLGGYGTGGGGSDADVNQARFQIDQGLNGYNDALGRIDSQLGTALGNIGGQYQSAYDRLMGQQAQAQRDYQTSRDNQIQDYSNARDNVNSNTRQLLSGARRLLGSQGAGGGSADLFAAPLAATTEGNNQNAAIKQTSERNLAALDTSNQDNKDAFGRSINDLNTQKANSENATRSQFEQQRSDILNNIASLTGQKALINGANYQQALAATQPYTSRIGSILNNIDALAKNVPTIQEQAVTLARPDLAQYGLGRFDAPAVAQQDATLAPSAYRALIGQPDDQQQRQQLI